MLMLLKPWRDISKDLRSTQQTWSQAFAEFKSSATQTTLNVLAGIEYLHESQRRADSKKEGQSDDSQVDDDDWDMDNPAENPGTAGGESSEASLLAIIQSQSSIHESLHAHLAIELAKRAQFFSESIDIAEWRILPDNSACANATGDDLRNLNEWRAKLEKDTEKSNIDPTQTSKSSQQENSGADVVHIFEMKSLGTPSIQRIPDSTANGILSPASISELNKDQRRAYEIITSHLRQIVEGNLPPPLRMIIYGEGGTGKLKVLQTVTECFRQLGCEHRLLKAAYTGVAASLINGKTMHVIGALSAATGRNNPPGNVGNKAKADLQKMWDPIWFLALDEMSMLAKDFFALLSRSASVGKQSLDDLSFGGVSVIILGDFHQFPPVAQPIRDALFYPSNAETDSTLGRKIYEEFSTIVILKEQKRITDAVWHDFLQHLRNGSVDDKHILMLQTLIIGKRVDLNVDFSQAPWDEAALLTPRHAVRHRWNDAALRKMCQTHMKQIMICTGEDTYKQRPLTMRERCLLEAHRGHSRRTNRFTSRDLSISAGAVNRNESDGDRERGNRPRYRKRRSG